MLDFEQPKNFGRYQIIEEIGAGGMGIVYKAVDQQTSQTVALKAIRPSTADKSHGIERFLREMELTSQLQHRNIVRLHDTGGEGDTWYFTMDYIDGQTLCEACQRLTIREITEIFVQITDAVAYAHGQGIIHRDLKPANIMITRDNTPIIMDFGLAKSCASYTLTASGMIIGSAYYMPPEQADGKRHDIDETSDVYSIGAILFEALTGTAPFLGLSSTEVLYKMFNEEPQKLRKLNENIPKALENICLKALEKQKQQRYLSARAMGDDLRRFLDGKPTVARAPHFADTKSWIVKHKTLLLVNAIVIPALFILVWLLAKIGR